MNGMDRRDFIIKAAGIAGAMVATGGSFAFAKDDAAAKTDEAINKITGGKKLLAGGAELVAPTIAENGAVVPVTVKAKGVTAKRIALFVDNNPVPLVFDAKVDGSVGSGVVGARIRMRKTSPVRAIVIDDKGKAYGDSKTIKVTIGGCG